MLATAALVAGSCLIGAVEARASGGGFFAARKVTEECFAAADVVLLPKFGLADNPNAVLSCARERPRGLFKRATKAGFGVRQTKLAS